MLCSRCVISLLRRVGVRVGLGWREEAKAAASGNAIEIDAPAAGGWAQPTEQATLTYKYLVVTQRTHSITKHVKVQRLTRCG
jgi:hypothetical protein